MLHSFGKLFDHLFPPSKEVLAVRHLSIDDIETYYAPRHLGSVQILLPYHEPEIRALIKAAKFFRHRQAAVLLATAVDRWLAGQSPPYLIIPIPLSRKRQRERGHNQVLSVLSACKEIGKRHHIDDSLLVRHTDTIPQTSLKKSNRASNVAGAFSTTTNASLDEVHVLLVDDVMTTGATLRAAEAALRPLRPATITKLAFAH